ncbi:TIGR04141 family sporadically distributed protein [Pectobacterium peruviense]|uniref:TIGR04141 family sporadically distributed protein n=1 Tax=Pectobacterium peruviense TaxID=2066479 RepID=UPI000DE25F66|nr:TIGR04141 family sporadically distributed protein [Pectobacterium peruviense]
MSKKMMALNILLAERKYSSEDFTFFLSKVCKEYPLNGVKGVKGSCFIKDVKENTPKWKEFFEGFTGDKIDDLITRSSSAVLLIKSKSRVFAITFGYGRSLLEQSYFVSDFGIKSALNMLKHDSLRSVDTFTIDDSPVQKKTQASLGTEISMFGVDISKDILRSVTGLPLDGVSFKNICGGDNSLQVKIELEPHELVRYLDECLQRYGGKEYLEQFSWVDNLKKVGKSTTIDDLDALLIRIIKLKKYDEISVVVPEVMSDEDIEYFSFTRAKHIISYNIDKSIYFNTIDFINFDIDKLKKDKLFAFNNQGSEVKNFSIYKCLNLEISHKRKNYMLFLGQWFEIEKKFSEYVEKELKIIPTHKNPFPDLIRTTDTTTNKCKLESEGDYNERICKTKKYILMDRKLVKSSRATTSIELCDLADVKNKILIHAKHRKGGSSGLSHLFAQASVASELILSDEEFRKAARAVIKENHGSTAMSLIPAKKINSSEFEVVLLILGSNKKTLLNDLPFFSKVNLINTYSNLTQRGFKVSVAVAE